MFMLVLFFFFFKQKTAYEMRISDWSSDVCSSDLTDFIDEDESALFLDDLRLSLREIKPPQQIHPYSMELGVRPTRRAPHGTRIEKIGRASCRERVCSTCRSRWSPYH